MSKRNKQRHKEREAKKQEALDRIHCPMCRKDDLVVDSDDMPGMLECARCAIRFWLEEVSDDTDMNLGTLECDACKGKGCHLCEEPRSAISGGTQTLIPERTTAPVVGAMVELTGVKADV